MGFSLIDFHCLCAHKIGPFDTSKSPPLKRCLSEETTSRALKYMFSETVTNWLQCISQTDSNSVHS